MGFALRHFSVAAKRKAKHFGLVSFLLVMMVLCGSILNVRGVVQVPVPAVPDLTPSTAQPYVLEFPANSWNYYVGKLSNGSYYGVNGSNCDAFAMDTNASAVFNILTTYANGVVFVANGNYTITTKIVGNTDITIMGESWSTWLVAGTNFNDSIIEASQERNFHVKNLAFDGNRANQPTGVGNDALVWIEGCNYSSIEDCFGVNAQNHGFAMLAETANAWHNKVLRNTVVDTAWNGIQIGGGGWQIHDTEVAENTVLNFCDVGLNLIAAYQCSVIGNHVALDAALDTGHGGSNSYYGIGTEGSGEFPLFADNTVDFSAVPSGLAAGGVTCMDFSGATKLEITDNMLVVNAYVDVGIKIRVPNSTITGGYITGFTQGGWARAIEITADAHNTEVDGVHFLNGALGIVVDDGADNCDVRNCVFRYVSMGVTVSGSSSDYTVITENNFDLATDDVSNSGTGTIYGYNVWYDGSYDTGPP